MQKETGLDHGQSGIAGRRRLALILRRATISLAIIATVMGIQMYLFYAQVGPLAVKADEQFRYLVAERHDWKLTQKLTDTITRLKQLVKTGSVQS